METTTVLMNIRTDRNLLRTFDRVCALSGSTRAHILRGLMRRHIEVEGPKAAKSLVRRQALSEQVSSLLKKRRLREIRQSSGCSEISDVRRSKRSFAAFQYADKSGGGY